MGKSPDLMADGESVFLRNISGLVDRINSLACSHPRKILRTTAAITAALLLLALLPTLFPAAFPGLHPLRIDTDPENMLSESEAVRVFHNRMKQTMGVHDLVVVGVLNETDPDGVFNPGSLSRIHELARFAGGLQWPADGTDGVSVGVIDRDMMSIADIDVIEPDGPGSIHFDWLMFDPPATRDEARAVFGKASRMPMFNGTVISNDGRAVALYIPVTSKDISYRVASRLQEKIAGFEGDDRFYITGMPVAQDAFGVEMFIQMAISAPAAMLVIFLLLYYFFRSAVLAGSAMLVAAVSVIVTMCLLVVCGHTVHIMSSMIPIFVMPIAVLDSVHMLSEFFDRYSATGDRRTTLRDVMHDLFRPMLYTSLTTATAFASLLLTPIPPVQVFGAFVAIGVLLAWVATITLVPAWIMCMPARRLAILQREHDGRTRMDVFLQRLGLSARRHAGVTLLMTSLAAVAGVAGILQIQVNDNPIRWFSENHPIRQADRVLNEHFGGTYMAYLTLSPAAGTDVARYAEDLLHKAGSALAELPSSSTPVLTASTAVIRQAAQSTGNVSTLLETGARAVRARADGANRTDRPAWKTISRLLDDEQVALSLFKDPQLLAWMDRLQSHLTGQGVAGKIVSLTDIVKAVYRDLMSDEPGAYRIPDTAEAIAQTLLIFQNSHRADDLWHFVTVDFRRANLWIQMKSGDNIDMARLEQAVTQFIAHNPPPVALHAEWFGLPRINKAWQEKMVRGMGNALAGSFAVVLGMMVILYRSFLWGLLAMIPLSATIALIYGIIGLAGKDYDMPVAVLSSLSLGLAVDFAIHFLERARQRYRQSGDLEDTVAYVLRGPAVAIARNALVVSIGFLPLLLAPLVPYNTVGLLIASILLLSALASLVVLPAGMSKLENILFRGSRTGQAQSLPGNGNQQALDSIELT